MPTPESVRPGGILKSSSSNTGRRAVWNESNLDQNEVIKAELNTTKIDEPKTPYHGPLQDEDDGAQGPCVSRRKQLATASITIDF